MFRGDGHRDIRPMRRILVQEPSREGIGLSRSQGFGKALKANSEGVSRQLSCQSKVL